MDILATVRSHRSSAFASVWRFQSWNHSFERQCIFSILKNMKNSIILHMLKQLKSRVNREMWSSIIKFGSKQQFGYLIFQHIRPTFWHLLFWRVKSSSNRLFSLLKLHMRFMYFTRENFENDIIYRENRNTIPKFAILSFSTNTPTAHVKFNKLPVVWTRLNEL